MWTTNHIQVTEKKYIFWSSLNGSQIGNRDLVALSFLSMALDAHIKVKMLGQTKYLEDQQAKRVFPGSSSSHTRH
jgi:uncharacterized membrane protein